MLCVEQREGGYSLAAGVSSAVTLSRVGVEYNEGSPLSREALAGVSLEVPLGRVTAVAGPTASGKSTLLQVMAGLISPSRGTVNILGSGRPVPGEVGMVLQRPEVQLFSANVWDDVAAAPRLRAVAGRELEGRVRSALTTVGLDPEHFASRSPFALSLGEQRRVAIAGILSLSPSLLILDEPGAGLDPRGRKLLMEALLSWVRNGVGGQAPHPHQRTLIFTSHDLDEVAGWAEHVVVLSGGRVVGHGPPAQILVDAEVLSAAGLAAPLVTRVAEAAGMSGPDLPVEVEGLARRLRENDSGSEGIRGDDSGSKGGGS